MNKRNLRGWKHSRPDHRDLVFQVTKKVAPASASVRSGCPRVEDQSELGSCTANSSTSAMEFLYRKKGLTQPELSRLFLYYTTRVLVENTNASDDSGCEIRDVMKSAKKYGVTPELNWPYDINKFSWKPSNDIFAIALNHQVKHYAAVKDLNSLKHCIGIDGYPVIIGFAVPQNMESANAAKTGIVNFPAANEQIIGGHAVLAVGYDDATQAVCFQNSWGTSWGDNGFGYLPYSFWTGTSPLVSDCWTIRTEEF
jgi:C1A family cysteine protease